MSIALTALWVLFVLAAWPRLTWDEMAERHKPLVGLWMAAMLPLLVLCAPLFAVVFLVVWVFDYLPRRAAHWWNGAWA